VLKSPKSKHDHASSVRW